MNSRVLRWWAGCLAGLVLVAGASILAAAQGTTAGIQGTITDNTGPLPGASIVAKDTGSGFIYEAVADDVGFFALKGLRPATYEITVAMPQYKPQARIVQVLVGQSVTVNFRVTADLVYSENVTVVGATSRLVETKTAEISTSVTAEQVRYLPQNQRNFLNFANLAPGVKMTQDDQNKQISAGAQDAAQVNVFIDGVSYKNDVLQGGVVGQDSSRGSPFPQNAVQEFQVLTQNYKAEHEKASSAVITAVTRSGTNRWSGEGFLFFQNKKLVSVDKYSKARALPKPTYERFQPGLSVGGPIVKDRLQIFGAYEENRQNRDAQVFLGGTPFPSSLNLDQFAGTFPAQFRERLLFTKATYQPRPGQHVDVSYSGRTESDVRGFGSQQSFESAEDAKQRIDSVLGRWQMPGTKWLNELTLTYQRFNWNPRPLNPTLIGRQYVGVIRVGGRDTTQDFIQERTSLRNDYTLFGTWNGNHTVKAGTVLSLLKYEATKLQNGNPLFQFRSDTGFAFPSTANYGFGNPTQSAHNKQFGFFAQDDWAITKRLTLNAGLRWDYESDMLNNKYVTPPTVREWAPNFNIDPNQYLTDGSKRPPFYGAWQPRLGISYDLTGAGKHILFGGYGRYYDRLVYNFGLDEQFRLQYSVLTFRFTPDGLPDTNGNPTIAWRPELLSKAGLDSLVQSGRGPRPEVFLIDNHTQPPLSDQFNAGVRTTAKGVLLTANYAGIRGRNGFTFIFGNRNPDGGCCRQIPPFSNLLLSSSGKKNWFEALYLTADRPFDGKWGLGLSYTLGKADAIGGDLFSLDYRTPADYPRHPAASDERNRVVATGIVGLPYDFVASGLLTISSGIGFTIADATRGFGFGQFTVLNNAGRPDHELAFRTVDVRIEKTVKFAHRQRVSLAGEAFNVFDDTNDACFDGFKPPAPGVNPKFGKASCVVANTSRRFQLGLRYAF
jgi:outer membrane receptor protein involved in Fe transport